MSVEQSPSGTFPAEGLIGEKTRLVRFDCSDITDRYLNWLNDSTVVQYSNQRFKRHSIESSREYLASFKNTDNLFLSIRRTTGGECIGTLTVYAAMPHGTADIGILIGNVQEWGCGYGLDAWNTVSDWLIAHCRMRKVTGGTLSCNEGMVKIFERSGMHLEGTRRAHELVEGIPMDTLYYARFRNA
jgi:ribosomal-protein-alanine N-acetyltransferase